MKKLNLKQKKNKEELEKFLLRFQYRIPKTIKINFTAYGTGGSYCPPNKITININNKNTFKIIIHEIIHLLIEEPFIKKHKIPHWEKEFIVDSLCQHKDLKNIGLDFKFQKNSIKPKTEIRKKLILN